MAHVHVWVYEPRAKVCNCGKRLLRDGTIIDSLPRKEAAHGGTGKRTKDK